MVRIYTGSGADPECERCPATAASVAGLRTALEGPLTDIDQRHLDDLIARLRARAADPARRTDSHRPKAPPATFPGTPAQGIGLGDLFGMGRTLGADVARFVRANQEGRDRPGVTERMAQLESLMATPVEPELPPPAPRAGCARRRAAGRLPPRLRRDRSGRYRLS